MQIEADVQSMAFGGHGIIKKDGLVIFVPFTVPKDRVIIEITKTKKRHAFGKVISIVKPSPFRQTPPCQYFGLCGGCQLQHISYEQQLISKQQFIKDAMQRIGGIECEVLPTIPAQSTFHYRRHITLSLFPEEKGFKACFHTANDNSLFAPKKCLLFEKPEESLLNSIQLLIKNLDNESNKEGSIRLLRNDKRRLIIVFNFPKKLPSNYQQIQEKLLHSGICEGGIWKAPKTEVVFGEIDTKFLINDLQFLFSPLGFVQNHPDQSVQIYQSIADQFTDPEERVLDLYCGIGISSLLLAKKGVKVVGIDQSKETIEAAKVNQKNNGIANAEFINAPAEKALIEYFEKLGATSVIVNPPRGGLSPLVLGALVAKRPKRIIYISCQPATLARDSKIMIDGNFKIKSCQPYDMFPQTTHVEVMLQLTRS